MKHRMGNTPKCNECFWFREKQTKKECWLDGWCVNKEQCAEGINSRKRQHPFERIAVRWNGHCRRWEDAECRLTAYEVLSRKPEPWRSRTEQEYVIGLLNTK